MDKKILVLTDSLALPRNAPEICAYKETWPELLKKKGHIIHQVSIGGATSTDLLRQVPYHKSFDPDYVILQVGIVDCTPRFMTQLEIAFCRKLGVFGKYIMEFMNKTWVRRVRKITYVNPVMFEKNLTEISHRFKPIPVYFIGIIPPREAYEEILPGMSKRVAQYNALLQNAGGTFISLQDFDFTGVMSDHHHLNSEGNWQIFKRIESYLNV